MRLIDADNLIPIMKYITTDNEIGVFPIKIGFNAIKGVIDEASTIDAVVVVRCKDCKHLKTMCEDEGTCYYWCKHWNNATDDWGHCYCGERREP